jgi:hypothetical protein
MRHVLLLVAALPLGGALLVLAYPNEADAFFARALAWLIKLLE